MSELEQVEADMTIEQFCDLHRACHDGRKWAISNCTSMQDAWEKLKADWLIWVATRTGVLTDKELRLFAVHCARSVEHLIDQRSRNAITVAEQHANGEATDDDLAAAWAAAWAAPWDAACAAPCAAARDAACAAAKSAARDAASAAARAAARDAAWDAAWDAARDAARAAAWAAARGAQNEHFETMLLEICK